MACFLHPDPNPIGVLAGILNPIGVLAGILNPIGVLAGILKLSHNCAGGYPHQRPPAGSGTTAYPIPPLPMSLTLSPSATPSGEWDHHDAKGHWTTILLITALPFPVSRNLTPTSTLRLPLNMTCNRKRGNGCNCKSSPNHGHQANCKPSLNHAHQAWHNHLR